MKQTQMAESYLELRREERRKYPRISTPVQAQIRVKGGEVPIRVTTSDVSLGGFYVEMSITIEPGTELEVTLWLKEKKIHADAIVVTCHPHFGNGIEFTSLTEEDQSALACFLDLMLNPKPHPVQHLH
ncbi:MAG TPA: PilZ domain-containing protein [Terriglobales bacterium]|nr:PilZ domain-containing protein [Terriglobales bacterium]